MTQYLGKALDVLWPVLLLAALWLVAGLVALFYARATRRPIFLFSGLAALLMVVERLLSPARIALHYVQAAEVYGGTAGKLDLLFGAYKYAVPIEGLAVITLLVGVILEVRRARRRAARSSATQAAGAAGMAKPVTTGPASADAFAQPPAAQPLTDHGVGVPSVASVAPDASDSQASPDSERAAFYLRPPTGTDGSC